MLWDVEGKLWFAALRKLLPALSFTCEPENLVDVARRVRSPFAKPSVAISTCALERGEQSVLMETLAVASR